MLCPVLSSVEWLAGCGYSEPIGFQKGGMAESLDEGSLCTVDGKAVLQCQRWLAHLASYL